LNRDWVFSPFLPDILPTAKKLLYDFYANGGGEVVVYAFQSSATDWAGYQTDIVNAINSLLAWRDADGVGLEFYVVPIQALTPPTAPTDADWQGLISAIYGGMLPVGWLSSFPLRNLSILTLRQRLGRP